MSLEMKVYNDPAAYEPKAMFGLTWRQLFSLGVGAPLCIGLYALVTWLLTLNGASLEQATNWAMPVLVILFLPFAAWGWWRPRRLHPEDYLSHVLDYYLTPKVITDGDHDRHNPRPAQRARRGRCRQQAPSERS